MKIDLIIKYSGLFFIATLCTLQVFAKDNCSFLYGGSKGKKHGGKVAFVYTIKSGTKKIDLEKANHIVDLNAYKEPVTISIQFSDLQLGLNKTTDKLRHNDHHKIFYMEIRADESNSNRLKAIQAPVKIAAANSHYGLNEAELHYSIQSVNPFEKTMTLSTPLVIVDGVYNRKWVAETLKKTITIIPKRGAPFNDPCVKKRCNKNEVCVNGECTKRQTNDCLHCKSGEICINQVCVQSNLRKTIEDASSNCDCEAFEVCLNKRCEKSEAYKLWEIIQADSLGQQSSTLKNCELYLSNCEAGIFKNCMYTEDVLCIQLRLLEDKERKIAEEQYLNNYPDGKCVDWIVENKMKNQAIVISIQPGFAKLQYDKRALVVHQVNGGEKPYYIDFFDFNKNKTYPIKRERFNKEYHCIELQNLKIPEGSYQVKVVDKAGNAFIEGEEIYVKASANLSKSAVVLAIILCGMFLFSVYRKYVHF